MPDVNVRIVYTDLGPNPNNDPFNSEYDQSDYQMEFFGYDTDTELPTYLVGNSSYLRNYERLPDNYDLPSGEIGAKCVGTTRRRYLYDNTVTNEQLLQGEGITIENTPNSTACGYVPPAIRYGCKTPGALNYDPTADQDALPSLCVFPVEPVGGCTNKRAQNYNPAATFDDGTCEFGADTMVFKYDDADCVQILYSERMQRWVTRSSWRAQHLFSVGDKFYSVPMPGLGRRVRPAIYHHEGNFGYYYDQAHESCFEVRLLGSGTDVQHILDNLMLVSNDVYPVRIEYEPEHMQVTVQPIVSPKAGNVVQRNAEYREGELEITVLSSITGKRQRAKTIRVKVVYSPRTKVLIEKMRAWLKDSFS